MKQIGLGLMQYCQDYDEGLPTDAPVPGWRLRSSIGAREFGLSSNLYGEEVITVLAKVDTTLMGAS